MRLFYALWPDVRTRDECATRATRFLEQHTPGGKPVPPERLHITLHFLGDVEPGRVTDLAAAARGLRPAPCELVLDLAGSFRGRGMPCWLGPTKTPPELEALHGALGVRLREAWFRVEERPWQPHVTIARNNRRQLRRAPVEPVTWPVDGFVLVESVRAGESTYRIIERFPP